MHGVDIGCILYHNVTEPLPALSGSVQFTRAMPGFFLRRIDPGQIRRSRRDGVISFEHPHAGKRPMALRAAHTDA